MAPLPTTSLASRSADFVTTSLAASSNLLTRSLHTLYTRQQATATEEKDELAFWQKHKPLFIGMLVAIPLQVAFGWWYMRRRKARRVILAEALATIEENKRRMKEMNLEHALNREGSMAGSMAGSSYSGRSYNGGMGGMGGMAGIGGMSRGDSMPMQTFSQSQMPPPVYDGKRGMEAFSGGKI